MTIMDEKINAVVNLDRRREINKRAARKSRSKQKQLAQHAKKAFFEAQCMHTSLQYEYNQLKRQKEDLKLQWQAHQQVCKQWLKSTSDTGETVKGTAIRTTEASMTKRPIAQSGTSKLLDQRIKLVVKKVDTNPWKTTRRSVHNDSQSEISRRIVGSYTDHIACTLAHSDLSNSQSVVTTSNNDPLCDQSKKLYFFTNSEVESEQFVSVSLPNTDCPKFESSFNTNPVNELETTSSESVDLSDQSTVSCVSDTVHFTDHYTEEVPFDAASSASAQNVLLLSDDEIYYVDDIDAKNETIEMENTEDANDVGIGLELIICNQGMYDASSIVQLRNKCIPQSYHTLGSNQSDQSIKSTNKNVSVNCWHGPSVMTSDIACAITTRASSVENIRIFSEERTIKKGLENIDAPVELSITGTQEQVSMDLDKNIDYYEDEHKIHEIARGRSEQDRVKVSNPSVPYCADGKLENVALLNCQPEVGSSCMFVAENNRIELEQESMDAERLGLDLDQFTVEDLSCLAEDESTVSVPSGNLPLHVADLDVDENEVERHKTSAKVGRKRRGSKTSVIAARTQNSSRVLTESGSEMDEFVDASPIGSPPNTPPSVDSPIPMNSPRCSSAPSHDATLNFKDYQLSKCSQFVSKQQRVNTPPAHTNSVINLETPVIASRRQSIPRSPLRKSLRSNLALDSLRARSPQIVHINIPCTVTNLTFSENPKSPSRSTEVHSSSTVI